MKTRKRIKKTIGLTVAFSLVIAVACIWIVTPVQAIIIIGTKTGLFGVTQGQKVRVSILNSAYTKGGVIPCVGIFDINGNEIAHYEGTMPLTVGRGGYFDFDADSLLLRGSERAQIRVEVELEAPTPDDGRAGRLKPDEFEITVEVFDGDSGKTMFTVPAVLKGFNPQPEPPQPQQ
jgi:hypothetical protein